MSSQYKTKFKPEYVQLLDQHLSDGFSFQSFAGVVKVGNFTLYTWINKYPEFKAVRQKYKYTRAKVYASCSGCKIHHIV